MQWTIEQVLLATGASGYLGHKIAELFQNPTYHIVRGRFGNTGADGADDKTTKDTTSIATLFILMN